MKKTYHSHSNRLLNNNINEALMMIKINSLPNRIRAMMHERLRLQIRTGHTTPRHPSLAEIKTATTRNSSRLAGQWNRATGDNVSLCQFIETCPAPATVSRTGVDTRVANTGRGQLRLDVLLCAAFVPLRRRALWNDSWSFNAQTFTRKRKFHRSRLQIAT